jgi:hypothetical protein
MSHNAFGALVGFLFLFSFFVGAMTFALHILFAVGVWRDAADRERTGAGVAFASAVVWALATLLGGVVVAGVYWVIHHSTLRPGVRSEKPHEFAEPLA